MWGGFWLATLLISGGGAHALTTPTVWREIGSVLGPEGFVAYVDPVNLPTEHIIVVTLTHVRNYRTPHVDPTTGQAIRSMTMQAEYDCHLEQERMLNMTWYSGPMGTGEVLRDKAGDAHWHRFDPGSVSALVWQVACR